MPGGQTVSASSKTEIYYNVTNEMLIIFFFPMCDGVHHWVRKPIFLLLLLGTNDDSMTVAEDQRWLLDYLASNRSLSSLFTILQSFWYINNYYLIFKKGMYLQILGLRSWLSFLRVHNVFLHLPLLRYLDFSFDVAHFFIRRSFNRAFVYIGVNFCCVTNRLSG